jgi:hypothetical protein
MFEVTTPDGRRFVLPQTDVGPAARTGRGIDVTSSAATQMGYTAKTFPTDGGFSYRRLDDDRAAVDRGGGRTVHTVEGDATITANINAPPGTDVKLNAGGIFKKRMLNRQTQMFPAEPGPDRREPEP